MYSTDHNDILHTSRQCNCRDVYKIFVVIGEAYYELERPQFWSKFEFDRNNVSGTGAWWMDPVLKKS